MLIDTHCHIDFTDFDADREAVIANANKLGIKHIIVPAVSASSWSRTINTCQQYNSLHLALGLHPAFVQQHRENHLTQLQTLITQHKPIAVGEIGLDFYHRKTTDKQSHEKQHWLFEQQLIIAKQHNLPVIIHNRKAHDECIALLAKHKVRGGIIHAFNGNVQQAHKYMDMHFLLGFGGMLTFERSRKLRGLLKDLPLSHIVMETDAPDMTVQQHQGHRNSPEYLPYILQSIAEIKQQSPEDICRQLNRNLASLFKSIFLD